VDNFTHSLAGWALGQAGLKTRTRKGLAALILGANMPDLDVFFGNVGWQSLAMHRGFTHGLVGGVLLMPPMLAGLLWLLDRWQAKRGARFRSGLPMRFGWLIALAYLGTLTHPFLDILTTYSVQLFAPISSAWWHADALFIIDAWLWTLLAGTIAWSRRQEKRGGEWRRPVRAAILVGIAYIGLNLGISVQAKSAVRSTIAPHRPTAMFASPPPVLFWRRDVVWEQPGGYGRISYDPLAGGLVGPARPIASGFDDPRVRAAVRADRGVRRFLRWSTMPIGRARTIGCEAAVSLGDARYWDPQSRARLGRDTRIPWPTPGCRATSQR
jgi:inner membrane protein